VIAGGKFCPMVRYDSPGKVAGTRRE
jgi:hypothetical protein